MQLKEVKYSIGQVSEMLDLRQSVLRYWEAVFPPLNPEKTAGGTRRYSREDVDLIMLIKNLLYEKKYTIKGAQNFLNSSNEVQDESGKIINNSEIKRQLNNVVSELEAIILGLKNH